MKKPPPRYLVLGIVALVAVAAAAIATLHGSNTSAKDRIEADPPPRLFATATIRPTEQLVAKQRHQAHTLVTTWLREHGNQRDDAAFATWVKTAVPKPPPAARRDREVEQVQKLAHRRTKAGVTASTWLEKNGKKDLWKLYAHDQAEMLSTKEGETRKADVKAMMKLSKSIADELGLRYRSSAPYVLHPSLRPDHTVKHGQVCPCSYPSRHAAAGAAAATYLGGLEPQRRDLYLWTEGQIDYSRIYMAGHVPSDISAGTLLGDLVGEYYLRTRP